MASSRTWVALLVVLLPCTLWAHADLDVREAKRAAQQPWPEPPPELALKLSSLGFRHFASGGRYFAMAGLKYSRESPESKATAQTVPARFGIIRGSMSLFLHHCRTAG